MEQRRPAAMAWMEWTFIHSASPPYGMGRSAHESSIYILFPLFDGVPMQEKFRSHRNHGWGRRIDFAGFRAIKSAFRKGSFGTQASYAARWRRFSQFCWDKGVKNLQKESEIELLEEYATYCSSLVQEGRMSVHYAHDLISAVNVVFSEMRGDDKVRVSPSEWFGKRCYLRKNAPNSLELEVVESVVEDLVAHGMRRAAAVFRLCRYFGLRREEATKADLIRWKKEIKRGCVNIQEGTKGGRRAKRVIKCGEREKEILSLVMREKPEESRNMMRPGETYWEFAIGPQSEIVRARAILHRHGVPDYKDARAAYACDRYHALSGYDAPVILGETMADRDTDLGARQQVAVELGHGRSSVVVAYLGGIRRNV